MTSPIGPRGGVMMIPLDAERHGDNWPRTLDVRLSDGTRLRADVAWVHPLSARSERRWTDDPRRIGIRAIDRNDDSSRLPEFAAGLGPYMLVRVPDQVDRGATMRVDQVTINPVWVDVAWRDPLLARDDAPAGPPLPREARDDRPAAESPFEYWRWVLLSDRMGAAPPAPPGDEIAQMAAEHYAAMWRIGMARLARASPRIAAECRHLLTHIALDRGRPVAAWIADPQQINALLARLVDLSRGEDAVLAGAVQWIDEQSPLMLWPGGDWGDHVRLAMCALRPGSLAVRLSWVAGEQPPAAVQLESGIIAHVTIERLPLVASPLLGAARMVEPAVQTLRVEASVSAAAPVRSFELSYGPRVTEARPPGVFFPPLGAPLTLADVQLNMARPIDPDRATIVHVRRLGGRWEVFFECRRIVVQDQRLDPASIRTYDDLRGIEAVTLLLGPDEEDGGPALWLTVAEHDWPLALRGGGAAVGAAAADLQVHKRSFADRWNCRIVLPEAWFSAAETNPALVGFIRSHGDGRQVETGPAASPPWRITPRRSAIDLEHWDDLPTVE